MAQPIISKSHVDTKRHRPIKTAGLWWEPWSLGKASVDGMRRTERAEGGEMLLHTQHWKDPSIRSIHSLEGETSVRELFRIKGSPEQPGAQGLRLMGLTFSFCQQTNNKLSWTMRGIAKMGSGSPAGKRGWS